MWNFIFTILFFSALGAVLCHIWLVSGGEFPHAVPVWDAILMTFATFRITRLVVYDKIARWFRAIFERPGGFFETVTDLLQCPWCIGFWSALIVAFCYFVFPWAWFIIFFLALAGAGSLLQVTANGIGWRAELLKMDAKEKGSL